MSDGSEPPLADVALESLTADDVTEAEVRAALDADDPVVRQRGARACAALAADRVESILGLADDLVARTADESLAVSRHAAIALTELSDAYPGAVADDLGPVVDLAESDLGGVRMVGARILGNVVVEFPEAVAPFVDRLVTAVADSEATLAQSDLQAYVEQAESMGGEAAQAADNIRQETKEEARKRVVARAALSNVVVAVAEHDPDAVAGLVDEMTPLVGDEDPNVAGAFLDVFRALAERDPETVAPAVDAVVDCLDRDSETLRARAIRTLGFAEATVTVDRLRTVAETDDDEDVRDLAAETADYLDSH
ncbi:MAG: hypothetical protein ABEJ26_00205 [Halosimplex sp.]